MSEGVEIFDSKSILKISKSIQKYPKASERTAFGMFLVESYLSLIIRQSRNIQVECHFRMNLANDFNLLPLEMCKALERQN